jgi:hypothetical protein
MLSSSHKYNPITYQTIGTFAPFIRNPAGYGKNFPILVNCIEGGQDCAAPMPCFNDYGSMVESANNAVSLWGIAAFRLGPKREFRNDGPKFNNMLHNLLILSRINTIHTTAQYGNGRPPASNVAFALLYQYPGPYR